MEGEIIDIEDEWIGVRVTDNNGVKHKIAVELDGDIRGHSQDGYPDEAIKRTPEGNEYVEQSRRYAQYYVARERGYDTIEWRHNPARLLATASAVAQLDTDAVAEHFGDLYDQVRSHSTDVERPVPLPDGVRPGHVNYQQDVYLGLSDEAMVALLTLDTEVENVSVTPGESIEDHVATLLEAAPAEISVPDASDLTIEAVSGVHVRWDDEAGQYHHDRNGQPDLDRNPDARFDVLPYVPEDIDKFQTQLSRNLLCQVRDAYVGMGVTPPEPFRIKGLGRHQIATLYAQFDFYQRYHDPSADIDWDALATDRAVVE
ncbi:hypothetical protein [Natrarchaeobaculum aegyptiacum]|uniref:Uncharacterized protein n=1 Tax=Natrarchaeobaculum aegyptiacum TaxID=745377 RepID=A0A2Z2HU47_9EURY|nr:hypothetical protein [Natrarchaeobaculum aegyptiacum]ARS90776.1 hypothetical protein B1756_14290 [Natrarchaeobaculum aegyptiacum]